MNIHDKLLDMLRVISCLGEMGEEVREALNILFKVFNDFAVIFNVFAKTLKARADIFT